MSGKEITTFTQESHAKHPSFSKLKIRLLKRVRSLKKAGFYNEPGVRKLKGRI